MSNIVKVQSNLARNEKEKFRFPIRDSDTRVDVWAELRFTEEEVTSWIDVGVVYPYAADCFRLARMNPSDFQNGSRVRSNWDDDSDVEYRIRRCIEVFKEQQGKKIDPFYGLGHLG